MTPDESLPTKQTVAFLNYICDFNATKTNYMLINKGFEFNNSDFEVQIDHNIISRVSSIKYLGVCIDDKLSWSSHINQVALKLSKCNGVIYKLRKYVNREALLIICYITASATLTFYMASRFGLLLQNRYCTR